MSKARAQHAGGMFDHPGRLLSVAAVAVLLLWAGFTAGFKVHEMLVGAVATAATVAFLANVLRTETFAFDLRLRDVLQVWQLPAAIARDSWILIVVLFKDLLGWERAGSFYLTCGFKTSRRDPLLVGRSALAVMYTTMSPNMMVIGIDPEQSLMLFHQLKRDAVPEYSQALGAYAGKSTAERHTQPSEGVSR